jgi:glycosyltransferase involved in cell wall biosynthesis
VASDIPGAREVVLASGLGRLVEPRRPAALATAVNRVLSEGTRTFDRREVAELFDREASIDAYEELLGELAGR